MAGRLFSAYPKTDYDDPDAALAMMVNVLNAYPLSVVERLTIETKSEALQLRYKFPPRLAEIKQAADALMHEEASQEARKTRVQQQLAERAEAEQPKGDRPSYDELKAKYGPNWGIQQPGDERKAVEKPFKAKTWDEIAEYYSKHPERIKKLTGPAGTR